MLKKVKNIKDFIFVPKHAMNKQSQDMYVYVGLPLIASVNNRQLDFANSEDFIVKQMKDPKIIIFKCKRRTKSRVKNGHRQLKTIIRIESIA